MKNILINTTLSEKALEALETSSYKIYNQNVVGQDCLTFIEANSIDTLITRSDLLTEDILANETLKTVGLTDDNAVLKDNTRVNVITSSNSGDRSVAEMVFGHILSTSRYLYDSNRLMPLEGDINFESLHQTYALGNEIKGKTLGVIGANTISKEVIKIAIAFGMNITIADVNVGETLSVDLEFLGKKNLTFDFEIQAFEQVCMKADVISFHSENKTDFTMNKEVFGLLKMGALVINTSCPGIIDEVALMEAIDEGIVKHAALDCYENQPKPDMRILMNPSISLSPNIASLTKESENRRGESIVSTLLNL